MQESELTIIRARHAKLAAKAEVLKRELQAREDVTVMAASLTIYAASGVIWQLSKFKFATIEPPQSHRNWTGGTITRFADPDSVINHYLKNNPLAKTRHVTVFVSHMQAVEGRPAIKSIGSIKSGVGIIGLLVASVAANGWFTYRSWSRERQLRELTELASWNAWNHEPPPQ